MARTTQTADALRVTLDQTACIRSQSNIGETITHNICTGQTAVVPWGSADWLGVIALCGIGVSVAAVFLAIAAMMVSDLRDRW